MASTLAPAAALANATAGASIGQQPVASFQICMPLQVLPMSIGRAPSKYALRATFQESANLKFQDGVCDTLEDLAGVVPDGMLVFMPSYGMMDKLLMRWKATGARTDSF
jgi:fanconi anemia group J protein